uniref:Protein draper-like isoform X2 n=1 Tax=Crassostrea virginica TaxID=6565 RepID=A0A8B8AW31_CRAVI|nr:protein draper-like isoform X2 [Crassostrea virginica]
MALCKWKFYHCMIIVLCSYRILSTSNRNKKPDSGMICPDEYVWNEMQNKCTSCMDGFIGRNCNVKCPPPSYGQECQLECKCQPSVCHHVFGCRRSESDCEIGKQGHFCENSCPYPSYDSTTKGPVSKMTEENTAAIEIGNWTQTSMKSHEMYTQTITKSSSLYRSVIVYLAIFTTFLIISYIILILYQRMCMKSSDNITRHAYPEPENIYMEL